MVILTPNDVGEVTVVCEDDLVDGRNVSQYGSGASDRIFIVDPDDFVATGVITLDPDLVLTVDTSGGANSFTSPYDVSVDGDDSVWVVDTDEEVIYRFSAADVGSLSGEESAAPACS